MILSGSIDFRNHFSGLVNPSFSSLLDVKIWLLIDHFSWCSDFWSIRFAASLI